MKIRDIIKTFIQCFIYTGVNVSLISYMLYEFNIIEINLFKLFFIIFFISLLLTYYLEYETN